MYKYLACLSLFLLLVGCAQLENVSGESRKQVQAEANKELEEAKSFKATNDPLSRIRKVNTFYVPKLTQKEQEKPSWFFESFIGQYKSFTLAEFMLHLQGEYGLNYRFLDGINADTKFALVTTGTVGDALEKVQLATAFGFTINDDVITWSKYELAHLDISFIPGITNYRIGDDDQNTTADTELGSEDTVFTDTGISSDGSYANFSNEQSNALDSLTQAVDILKSETGEYTIDVATSTLVVRDYPENIRRIREHVYETNRRRTAQVILDIKIVDYVKSIGDEFALNWDAVVEDLGSSGVASLATGFQSSILNSSTPSVFTYTKNEGKYAGSQAIVEALKSRGVLLNVIEPSVTLMNNKVGQVFDGSDRAYLASAGTTSTANVGQSDILIPGVVRTGLRLWGVANINIKDDSIIAKISNRFSSLTELSAVSSGGSTIQTPETATKKFEQDFYVKDGETILISGLTQTRREFTENTNVSLLLGGEKATQSTVTETLILVTPRILRN